ncbi:MAG: polysaccharide deacetylase family protein [Alcanivoracaceae bacterium]|nr:polysaccharide deacetylase family protein [Alcanivoracaceae bacterium]
MLRAVMEFVRAALLLIASMPLLASAAVILQYHHVAEDTPAATSVTPAQFAGHLQALADEGFEVVPLTELFERVRNRLDARERVAAITFDDGYDNLLTEALPLLDRHDWKAAIFVTSGDVGKGGMLDVDDLRAIKASGHLVLNHTQRHPHLVRQHEGESRTQWLQRIEQEITGAQAQLERWLGESLPKILAYPYGEHDDDVRALLQRLGYIGVGQHTGALDAAVDWQQVPRIPVNRRYADWESLRDKVLALPMPVTVVSPDDGVTESEAPVLSVTLPAGWRNRALNCFASGAAITPQRKAGKDAVQLTLQASIPVGRSRYTCTASAGEGRFYWFTWVWMRRSADGWYPEY